MEVRRGKRPRQSDLRAGGRLEQEADIIMMVYRDDHYNAESSTTPGIVEISVFEHINGTTSSINLAFSKARARF